METVANQNRNFVTEVTHMHVTCWWLQIMGGLSFRCLDDTPNGLRYRFQKKTQLLGAYSAFVHVSSFSQQMRILTFPWPAQGPRNNGSTC